MSTAQNILEDEFDDLLPSSPLLDDETPFVHPDVAALVFDDRVAEGLRSLP